MSLFSKSQACIAPPKLNENYVILNQSHKLGIARSPYHKLPSVGHSYGLKPQPNADTTKTCIFVSI